MTHDLNWIIGTVIWLGLLVASAILTSRRRTLPTGMMIAGTLLAFSCKLTGTIWVIAEPIREHTLSGWTVLLAIEYASDLGRGFFVFGFVMFALAYRREARITPRTTTSEQDAAQNPGDR